jgi:hypothetical protein
MPNREAGIPAAKPATFGSDNCLISDQDHFDIAFLGSLESPLNGRGWSMVTAHDVKRNLHKAEFVSNDDVKRSRKRRSAVTTLLFMAGV